MFHEMNSGKIKRKRMKEQRSIKREQSIKRIEKEKLRNRVLVNETLLRPTNSYGTPRFVQIGFYEDMPFKCKDCGKEEVWRDTQQKWWYEVMKGDVWTVAVRCRTCRRKERERKNEARRIHMKGLANNET